MPKKTAAQPAAKPEKTVPENIKKKLERDAKRLKDKKQGLADAKRERKFSRKLALDNAEKYAKEYAAADQAIIDGKRAAKKAGSFFVESEPKVAFIIRIKGINKLAPKPKKIMQLFRLRQLHNGVFVKLNKATWNMI
jgi:60S ribosomal protein uL30